VERGLYDIFGLRLPYKNVYRFRSTLAGHYVPLQKEILAAILSEDVINIDETPVNLRKTTGYVWVLATHNNVYYAYKESRESVFLKDLLANFSGVLVAEFFTAYDSLKCRHQKCLVHLMRDINDDLRRHPFDEELRYIAQEFGVFLAHVVSTIDRWGLKSHHLHKHIKESDKMLRQIHRKSFASEQAVKYQKRFEKYAESLFTFLRYDNIPWNNNNAEHAVHYFAKVRRFSDGTFTSSSIEELLTLVTVLQTCEYRGVNALQFLLSGRTSLAAMTGQKCRHRTPPSIPSVSPLTT
jgi:Transposase IS66 family